ncbi:double-CXXCG motif protein [Hyalangium minutum]|uniref:SitI6 family double-CXXCG motif immunity protein n=1 Tax=Hyalangium minutum TaxID=394096 RepID=UPI0004E64803|nr:double-CXXCG motif protein [Hyalangium minutum]
MRFYWLQDVASRRYSATHTDGHKWCLPGASCPVCQRSGGTSASAFPSVDLSHLPPREQKKYSARLEEDFAEFERLREQVRPWVPTGVPLWPGTDFGPMTASIQGEVGPLLLDHPWILLMRRESLEHLQKEGLQGLKGCRTELRFRTKNPPELLEMELLPRGRFHAECLPERSPPCPKCERVSLQHPKEPVLDAATLPKDVDVFRLEDSAGMILGTERFVDAVRHLGYSDDLLFRELPVRAASPY